MLATGGGAFMNPETRALIKSKAVSVWLKADLEVLARRVGRKDSRPAAEGQGPARRAAGPGRGCAIRPMPRPTSSSRPATPPTTSPSSQVIRALSAYLEEQAPMTRTVAVGLGERSLRRARGPGLLDARRRADRAVPEAQARRRGQRRDGLGAARRSA